MQHNPPFHDPDSVLGSLARELAATPNENFAQVLTRAASKQEFLEHDNFDGGTTTWRFTVCLYAGDWGALGEDGRAALETATDAILQTLVPATGYWVRIALSPQLVDKRNWRTSLQEPHDGPTNQGRAHSKNVAALEFDGLLFRSEPEKTLYSAFKRSGAIVAPLPVFVRGGDQYSRVEPDFVVVRDGVVVFVEVDGQSFHRETPTDAHYRLKPFEEEGIRVMRVKAAEVATRPKADHYVKKVMSRIEKWVRQR